MSDINVKTYSWQEVQTYKEQKYHEFLKYYFETTLKIGEIFKTIGLNKRNSTTRYIRKQLKDDGHNSFKRASKIRKGEWL